MRNSTALRLVFLMVLVVFVISVMAPNVAIAASANTWKTAAIVLGAFSVYSIAKKKNTNALISGAGAYYAYKRYSKERDRDRWRHRR